MCVLHLISGLCHLKYSSLISLIKLIHILIYNTFTNMHVFHSTLIIFKLRTQFMLQVRRATISLSTAVADHNPEIIQECINVYSIFFICKKCTYELRLEEKKYNHFGLYSFLKSMLQ